MLAPAPIEWTAKFCKSRTRVVGDAETELLLAVVAASRQIYPDFTFPSNPPRLYFFHRVESQPYIQSDRVPSLHFSRAESHLYISVGPSPNLTFSRAESHPGISVGPSPILAFQSGQVPPLHFSRAKSHPYIHVGSVYRPECGLSSGPSSHAFGSRGLGVSTFPWGRATDKRERRSRHLSFYDLKVEGG
ncbi:hypothetical protein CRG98_012321 [Punica granatum]|uniref:Uncharacterized protein n=1 Tax=Punica granatum TaxID=22663 RepID=A0A2I0KFL1_PUNGR|nr:hypothetical protein CRG98_012321 [Punica granatum]